MLQPRPAAMRLKLSCCPSPNSFRPQMSLFWRALAATLLASLVSKKPPPNPKRWPGSSTNRCDGTWSDKYSETRRALSPSGPTPPIPSTARAWSPRSIVASPPHWTPASAPNRLPYTCRSASTATRREAAWTCTDRSWWTRFATQVAGAPGLSLVGLMGIPPLGTDPEQAFARLREEHLRVLDSHPQAASLSAGMSDDLEAAIKHGSTCVRVGTALLGPRPLSSPSVVTPVTPTSSSHQAPSSRRGHR